MEKKENGICVLKEKYMVNAQRISELTKIPMRTLYSWECGASSPRSALYNLINYRLSAYRVDEKGPIVADPPPEISDIKSKYCFTNESLSKYTGFSFATVQSWSSGQTRCKPYIRYLICFKLQSEKF